MLPDAEFAEIVTVVERLHIDTVPAATELNGRLRQLDACNVASVTYIGLARIAERLAVLLTGLPTSCHLPDENGVYRCRHDLLKGAVASLHTFCKKLLTMSLEAQVEYRSDSPGGDLAPNTANYFGSSVVSGIDKLVTLLTACDRMYAAVLARGACDHLFEADVALRANELDSPWREYFRLSVAAAWLGDVVEARPYMLGTLPPQYWLELRRQREFVAQHRYDARPDEQLPQPVKLVFLTFTLRLALIDWALAFREWMVDRRQSTDDALEVSVEALGDLLTRDRPAPDLTGPGGLARLQHLTVPPRGTDGWPASQLECERLVAELVAARVPRHEEPACWFEVSDGSVLVAAPAWGMLPQVIQARLAPGTNSSQYFRRWIDAIQQPDSVRFFQAAHTWYSVATQARTNQEQLRRMIAVQNALGHIATAGGGAVAGVELVGLMTPQTSAHAAALVGALTSAAIDTLASMYRAGGRSPS